MNCNYKIHLIEFRQLPPQTQDGVETITGQYLNVRNYASRNRYTACMQQTRASEASLNVILIFRPQRASTQAVNAYIIDLSVTNQRDSASSRPAKEGEGLGGHRTVYIIFVYIIIYRCRVRLFCTKNQKKCKYCISYKKGVTRGNRCNIADLQALQRTKRCNICYICYTFFEKTAQKISEFALPP